MPTAVTPGTLADDAIRTLCSQSILIDAEFSAAGVGPCCYDLRASDIAFETMSSSEDKRVVIPEAGYVLRPNSFLTVITAESLNLPPDVLGRVLTKGQLFSVGLMPVNTYADPGFKGRLGITLYNASKRYLIIRRYLPIAKIEFTVLPVPAQQPYVGQHGFATGIWPIPAHLFAKNADLSAAGIHIASADELERTLGVPAAELHRAVAYYSKKVWIQLWTTLGLFGLLLVFHDRIDLVSSLALGILGNVLTNFVPSVLRGGWRRGANV
jgi:dCTP deaminase